MSTDPKARVMRGTKFRPSAKTWNDLMDLLDRGEGPSGIRTTFGSRRDVIKVRNESDEVVNQFGILGLGDPIISPTDNETEFRRQVAFVGETPETAHGSKYCVALETINIGEIGRAAVSGLVPVRLAVSGSLLDAATVTDGSVETLTNASTGGARVIWAESSGSERWALVRLGDPVASSGASAFSGARVYRNSTQTDATGSMTISYNSEQYDTDGYWTISNPTRLTIPSDGLYSVGSSLSATTSVPKISASVLQIKKTGTPTVAVAGETRFWGAWPSLTRAAGGLHHVHAVLNLVAGDYLETEFAHDDDPTPITWTTGISGANLPYNSFWIHKLGELP